MNIVFDNEFESLIATLFPRLGSGFLFGCDENLRVTVTADNRMTIIMDKDRGLRH